MIKPNKNPVRPVHPVKFFGKSAKFCFLPRSCQTFGIGKFCKQGK